jgi:sugar phosphate isomerase/epimerase
MKWGISTSPAHADDAKATGWDFIEGNVQSLLEGGVDDSAWSGLSKVQHLSLPQPAANCLAPGSLKITGPAVDATALDRYMHNVLSRAPKLGLKTLVFGSGAARNVPEGFDREQAKAQIIDFLRRSAPVAQKNGVTLVIEPLNRKECNIINSVAEAMEYVKAVDSPAVQCLVDSYHFWLEKEPLENLRAAMPWIKHVHLADEVGRTAPGTSEVASDYRAFFAVLKQAGYDGLISVEAKFDDIPGTGRSVLAFLKKNWTEV